VIQPTVHTKDDRTEATKENAGRTIQPQSDCEYRIRINLRGRDVDGPRSKDREVGSLGIENRDDEVSSTEPQQFA
jgi:hypothetical protein